MSSDCCGCGKNELSLCKLHAEKAVIDCLCATNIKGKVLNVMDEVANNICAQKVQSKKIEAEMLNANDLCSQRGVINSLCVNDLTVKNINHCEEYRAAVTISSDITYTLGASLDWDTVIDDPNGNVAIGPFSYTIPISGYYILSFHVESAVLSGVQNISGTPIGLLNVLSNGNPLRQLQAPLLAFSNTQSGNLTSVSLLNAGDVITMTYDTLVFDPTNGLIKFVGTVSMYGNGTFPGKSGFAIHYLSTLNCQTITCNPCPPVVVPCTSIEVDCHECQENQCMPLNSTMPSQCKPCNPCLPGR